METLFKLVLALFLLGMAGGALRALAVGNWIAALILIGLVFLLAFAYDRRARRLKAKKATEEQEPRNREVRK